MPAHAQNEDHHDKNAPRDAPGSVLAGITPDAVYRYDVGHFYTPALGGLSLRVQIVY